MEREELALYHLSRIVLLLVRPEIVFKWVKLRVLQYYVVVEYENIKLVW
jgi:hypothetical protein